MNRSPIIRRLIRLHTVGLAGVIAALATSSCKTMQRKAPPVVLDNRGIVPPPYLAPSEGAAIKKRPVAPPPVAAIKPQKPRKAKPALPKPVFDPPPAIIEEPQLTKDLVRDLDWDKDIKPTTVVRIIDEPEPLPKPKSKRLTYKVQKGDSLWKIGRMYGVSMGELAAANSMSVKDTLKIGHVLELPAGASFVPESKRPVVKKPAPKKAAPRKIAKKSVPGDGKHIVKKGDSLWVISRSYGIPVQKLMALNGLKSDRLMPNQVLVLKGDVPAAALTTTGTPPKTTAVTSPPPRSSGTVPSTAINAKVTTTPTAVITGQPAATAAPKLKKLPHFVLEGDTLSAVAEIYGSKVEWIKSANTGVTSDSDLKVGGKIMVPVEDID